MITIPAGVRIHLAMGITDMRKGFDGLAMLAQEVLKLDPFSGHFFIFRGRRGDLVKVLYWDSQGFCLFSKRLEKGNCSRGWRRACAATRNMSQPMYEAAHPLSPE